MPPTGISTPASTRPSTCAFRGFRCRTRTRSDQGRRSARRAGWIPGSTPASTRALARADRPMRYRFHGGPLECGRDHVHGAYVRFCIYRRVPVSRGPFDRRWFAAAEHDRATDRGVLPVCGSGWTGTAEAIREAMPHIRSRGGHVARSSETAGARCPDQRYRVGSAARRRCRRSRRREQLGMREERGVPGERGRRRRPGRAAASLDRRGPLRPGFRDASTANPGGRSARDADLGLPPARVLQDPDPDVRSRRGPRPASWSRRRPVRRGTGTSSQIVNRPPCSAQVPDRGARGLRIGTGGSHYRSRVRRRGAAVDQAERVAVDHPPVRRTSQFPARASRTSRGRRAGLLRVRLGPGADCRRVRGGEEPAGGRAGAGGPSSLSMSFGSVGTEPFAYPVGAYRPGSTRSVRGGTRFPASSGGARIVPVNRLP